MSTPRRWLVDPPGGSGFEARQFDLEEQANKYAEQCPPRTRIVDRGHGPLKVMDTAALLAERKTTHGNYDDDARCAMTLLHVLNDEIRRRHGRGQPILSDAARHAIGMILHKIARIVTGQADFKDHWDDVAGYAKLVADRCEVPGSRAYNEATGCADDCTHPSHRHGRPGRRADDCQGEDPGDVTGYNKPPCMCIGDCAVERGVSVKYTYCKQAEFTQADRR